MHVITQNRLVHPTQEQADNMVLVTFTDPGPLGDVNIYLTDIQARELISKLAEALAESTR